MGLDIVEMIGAIEEAFAVKLTVDEVVGAETVGELVDVVYARLRQSPDAAAPAQRGFHKVRRTLMTICRAPRRAIRLNTPLLDLLPHTARESVWDDLRWALDADRVGWPSLRRMERQYPAGPKVADLIPYVGSLSTEVWSRSEVEEVVIEIVADHRAIDMDDIRPESRFVEDLGMD